MGNGPRTSGFTGVARAFASVALSAPDRVAVRLMERAIRYADLEERSRRFAAGLRASGVSPGDRVLLALPRGVDLIVGMLGTVRCGAAYVPVDPKWPAARLGTILGLAEPVLCVASVPGEAIPNASSVHAIEQRGDPSSFADHDASPDDPIYIMFTSGTTGEPKGVVVPHRAVFRLVDQPDFMEVGEDRTWLQLAATSFDAATLEIWTPLVRGAAIAPVEDPVPSLDGIAGVIERTGVTDAWLTASLFNAFVDYRIGALGSMKQILTGGERLSPEHVARFLDTHPEIALINGYGPTENTTFTCCHLIDRADADLPGGVPIGRPIRGTTVRIVDEHLAPVADGEAGELLAGGDGVALGYLGDAALTAARFVALDGEPGSWYRTGDLVRRAGPAAPIEFMGRRDRQVKVRGHRIELEEVERVLRACAGVGQAFAFVLGSRADDRRLIGAVALREDASGVDPASIRADAARAAPDYIVPDRVVVLEEVPIGPTGKADRDAIEASVRGDHPTDSAGAEPEARSSAEDSSGTWSRFASLVEEVLHGVRPDPDDGFLDLGGHSIAALRLAAAVTSEFGVPVGVGEILRAERLGDLAARLPDDPVDEHEVAGDEGQSDAPLTATPAASSIQRQFFFENAVDPTGIAYHEHAAFFVADEAFDPDRMVDAFRALVRRHEALRTKLVLEEAGLVQLIEPPSAADEARVRMHPAVEWDGLAAGLGDERGLPATVHGAIAVPFELERDLPARLDLFPIESGGLAVVLSFQHAAIDEWSLGIIESELGALYADPASLGVSGIPYRVFSERERLDAAGAAVDALVDRLLTVGEPRVELGRAPAEGAIERGAWLDEGMLDDAASSLGVTPTALGAGLYAWALGEVLGLSRVALITPISRRLDRASQAVVGCCNLMRPFVVDAGGNTRDGVASAVASARDALLSAYESPPVAYDHVARELRRRGGQDVNIVPFGYANETRPPFQPDIPGLATRPAPLRGRIARFRIGLSLDRRAGSLIASLSGPRHGDTPRVLKQVRETMRGGLDLLQGASQAVVASVPSQGAVEARSRVVMSRSRPEPTEADRAAAERAWREVLGVPPSGAEARFFDAGGHSLLLLRMSASIRRDTGIEIPLGAFLDEPTFGGLLGLMVRRRASGDATGRGFAIEEFGEGDRVVVGIPGAFGRPLAFRRLADELAARRAGIVLRAYNMFDAASDREIAQGFDLVRERLAADFAKPEVVGAIGYCAGGLYPLYLDSLPESTLKRMHLWLVNVFAPDRPGAGKILRAQSLRDAAMDVPGWPRAAYSATITAARMAAVRIRGRTRGVDGDLIWHAGFRRVIAKQELRAWRGQATVFIAGNKPPWRHYYRNDRLNGLTELLSGPTRPIVLRMFHHELLTRGAPRIASEMLADLGVAAQRAES